MGRLFGRPFVFCLGLGPETSYAAQLRGGPTLSQSTKGWGTLQSPLVTKSATHGAPSISPNSEHLWKQLVERNLLRSTGVICRGEAGMGR